MSNLYWLTGAQMERLKPFFPKSHGKPRVDDRRVLSGIIFINRSGLRWCDAPKEYGLAKSLYNRWKRWSDNGVFARIMVGLAAESAEHKTIMIDATYLKAHRVNGCRRGKMAGQSSGAGVALKLVVADWVDSRRPTSSYQHLDDIEPQSAVACQSVGWLIQDGKALVVAQNLGDMGASPLVSGCICIPAQCVTGVLRLNSEVS